MRYLSVGSNPSGTMDRSHRTNSKASPTKHGHWVSRHTSPRIWKQPKFLNENLTVINYDDGEHIDDYVLNTTAKAPGKTNANYFYKPFLGLDKRKFIDRQARNLNQKNPTVAKGENLKSKALPIEKFLQKSKARNPWQRFVQTTQNYAKTARGKPRSIASRQSPECLDKSKSGSSLRYSIIQDDISLEDLREGRNFQEGNLETFGRETYKLLTRDLKRLSMPADSGPTKSLDKEISDISKRIKRFYFTKTPKHAS